LTVLTPLEELTKLIAEQSRRIFVAEKPLDLRDRQGTNCVYVLQLPTSAPGAAGGRIGGVGERRIQKVCCFRLEKGNWLKTLEIEKPDKIERFELPYQAAGLSITLPDGTERTVSGVIDEELAQQYNDVA
jgi:hypothetical protein